MYDLSVAIMRAQPFHLGHQLIIDEALKISKSILICLGSANQPRTPKNPWTVQERAEMIFGSQPSEYSGRIFIAPIRDFLYNEGAWLEEVQQAVRKERAALDAKTVTLIGYTKDSSSYYLKSFPQYDYVEAPVKETINATDLRDAYFSKHFMQGAPLYVSPQTLEYLREFEMTEAYAQVAKEQDFIFAHKKKWAFAPYEPTFNCADAVVVQSGHILLIQRKKEPGKGLWALPGGHLDKVDKTYEDCAIRELIEETQIDIMEKVLRSRIKAKQIFMHPDRSLRGRYITEASFIELEQHGDKLPKVKGSDDASVAKWFSFAEFRKMEPFMFEDHYAIISHFLG